MLVPLYLVLVQYGTLVLLIPAPLYLVLVQYGTLVLLIPALKEVVIFGELSDINRSQTCPCCNLITGEGFTCT